ncbi:MAG: response regulator transcription factor [Cytophagaceae bacterium]|nr:MAG: response regulator transcription factor [Cytophagaceae bacterium]
MIKVVIVSNLSVLREGAKRILLSQGDMDVIAEVSDVRELGSNNLLSQADVIIVIADTGTVTGSDYLLLLHQQRPSMRVVMLLRYPTMQQILSILRTGVRGLLSASSAATHLPIAVRAASSGRLYLNDELTRLLIPDHSGIGKDYTHKSLTDRELEVFLKLAAGKKVSEIAAQLGISIKTVSTHKARLMDKMNMSTFSQMVQYALAYGLCDPSRAD